MTMTELSDQASALVRAGKVLESLAAALTLNDHTKE